MKRLCMAILPLMFLAVAVQAVPLDPGTTIYNPNAPETPVYTTTLPSYFTAGNLVDQMTDAYTVATGNITGSVTSIVYRDPATNFLGFQYQFTSTGASDLIRATIGSNANEWSGITIFNAGANGGGASTPGEVAPVWSDGNPYFILRDPTDSGEGVTFQWRVQSRGTRLAGPDDFSALIFLETDATLYQVTDVGLIDSGAVSSAQAFAPAIPEPTTLTLLGLGGLALLRKRRKA